MMNLPPHLRPYIVEQHYEKYTAIDQAVWRFIMRQLKNFMVRNAHSRYSEGLEKTGISTERIPDIVEMSACLEKFGWRAVPVSGFIPPAAFMELQSMGILPIASDMRTLAHLTYTPAPDIVHEAAGHAPLLIDKEFSAYLRKYSEVSRKAILSKEDLEMYKAIRELSDLKEDPRAAKEDIEAANLKLEKLKSSGAELSEAALLARMNWWTAEYGLIEVDGKNRIYGAGLMSSVGESRTCLEERVKKIPFSLECLDFAYDITEPQPQLFVTKDFKALAQAIEELAKTMAYRTGGMKSLRKAVRAGTVNTIELNSGVQVSGVLTEVIGSDQPAYLKFSGPVQICYDSVEIPDQGRRRHADGFSTPVGKLKGIAKCMSEFTLQDFCDHGWWVGELIKLEYESGVVVKGRLNSFVRREERLALLTFVDCTVTLNGQTLFRPEWGFFDLAVGSSVPSVYGGPADRSAFGEIDSFDIKRVSVPFLEGKQKELNALFQRMRHLRSNLKNAFSADSGLAARGGRKDLRLDLEKALKEIWQSVHQIQTEDWLIRLEIYEMVVALNRHWSLELVSWTGEVLQELLDLGLKTKIHRGSISDGVKLADEIAI